MGNRFELNMLRTCHRPGRRLSTLDVAYLIYSHSRPMSWGLYLYFTMEKQADKS